jgi:mRNA interferase RelE/StbE
MAASRYRLEISSSAEKSLKKIPHKDQLRLSQAILGLATDPHPSGSIKLSGEENCYRIRMGNYRIIYEIVGRKLLILVLKIAHRKEVYRR